MIASTPSEVECLEILAGEFTCRRRCAGMQVQGAAAPLILWISRLHSRCGRGPAESPSWCGRRAPADAPREQGYSVAPLTDGGHDRRQSVSARSGSSLRDRSSMRRSLLRRIPLSLANEPAHESHRQKSEPQAGRDRGERVPKDFEDQALPLAAA